MRNKKILATAITAALAGSLGASGVNAGALTVFYPVDTETNPPSVINPSPMYVATEEIGINQTLSDACPTGAASRVQVTYVLDNDLVANDQITFQLNEGSSAASTAVFQTAAGNEPGASAGQISPNTLVITAAAGGGSGLFALSGGGEGTNTLTFAVQGSGISKNSSLTFSFCVDKADLLEEQGQSLGITLSFPTKAEEAGGTITVIGAQQGSNVTIDEGEDDGKVKVNIGSDAGAKKFTGSSLGEDTAILGEFCFSENETTVYKKDLKNPWNLDAALVTGITFTITDAPFNASIGHVYAPANFASPTADEIAGVMVFLDTSNVGTSRGVFDAADIPADTVNITGATFTIAAADNTDGVGTTDIASLLPAGAETEKCVNLIFKVSGNDEIKTLKIPPTGKVTMTFTGGAVREFSGSLNHIKRSGTVCVLYNIPGPNSVENANVRIINKSAVADGTLVGTLRLPDGTEIFTDYDILTAAGLGLIGPNQTMYFNTATLDTIAKSATNPNGVWDKGWTRAILRLESNLDYVEMMALIRDDDVSGAPLMNMSAGASGNGCGR